VALDGAEKHLKGVSGILVPGGFGSRGVEGKIEAIRYARETKTPFLGLCLGMQCAVIEFARNVCGLSGAHSREFWESTPHPVINLMQSQESVRQKGGTMRLGSCPCDLAEGSLARKTYGVSRVHERHRHRYELNNAYRAGLEARGLRCSGVSPNGELVEMVELVDHPWFVATQFHPEFKSKPLAAHPLFRGFIGAALSREMSASPGGSQVTC
jgi:CTP synthase